MMAQVYQETGDTVRSKRYQAKFNTLAVQAEGIFEQSDRSKGDAEAYMQKHVDTLAALAEKDATLVLNFAKRCDQRYPN